MQSGEQNRASKIQQPGTRILDAAAKIVTPGLVDIHVYLREPGFE
jgi:dihydroorotase